MGQHQTEDEMREAGAADARGWRVLLGGGVFLACIVVTVFVAGPAVWRLEERLIVTSHLGGQAYANGVRVVHEKRMMRTFTNGMAVPTYYNWVMVPNVVLVGSAVLASYLIAWRVSGVDFFGMSALANVRRRRASQKTAQASPHFPERFRHLVEEIESPPSAVAGEDQLQRRRF